MSKLIHGVGLNDADYPVRTKQGMCPFYSKWSDMIKRCYSDKYIKRNQTYKDCSVCEEWLIFSNFKSWMIKQDWEGKHLDKDIINYGNKVYSPGNCAFVSRAINNLILTNPKIRGRYSIGVHFDKRRSKYQASIKVNGKNTNIGRYNSEEEAANAYKNAKKDLLIKAARSQIDQRVASGLEKKARLL